MDIVHLLKKALVFGFASLALLPPVLLFAFDIGKWLAALPGLFWLLFGIFIGLFSFLWLYPRLNPAGNREAQALLAKARAGNMDAQFAAATAFMERQHGLVRTMGRLGHMYLLGNAVERDSLTAYFWLARAVFAAHTLPDTESRKWEGYRD